MKDDDMNTRSFSLLESEPVSLPEKNLLFGMIERAVLDCRLSTGEPKDRLSALQWFSEMPIEPLRPFSWSWIAQYLELDDGIKTTIKKLATNGSPFFANKLKAKGNTTYRNRNKR